MLFFQSERPQWTCCHGAIAWDGQALSFESSQTKRSLYLASEPPSGLLYQSRSTGRTWVRLFGGSRGSHNYRIAADTSRLAYVVSKVRDAFADFIESFMGSHLAIPYRILGCFLFTLLVVVGGPLELISQVALCSFVRYGAHQVFGNAPKWTVPYPIGISAVGHITLGALTWLPSLVICSGIESVTRHAVRHLSAEISVEQDIVELMRQPGIGPVVSLYAAIGAPIIEELLFRGALYDGLVANERAVVAQHFFSRIKTRIFGTAARSSMFHWERIKTILKTSILFGLCHGSAHQGAANIPIIAVTTFMGLVLAILREITGDLWASTTMHAVHNTAFTLRLHGLLPPHLS